MENTKNNTHKRITIAIDGWSSCGKSTLAKALAKELHYTYVDSGAMYRGIALFALNHNWVSPTHIDEASIRSQLPNASLTFQINAQKENELFLNNKNVESAIRNLRVSSVVSKVAKIKEVREFLVSQQQKMGEKGGIVMDGRDIGSVVFPNAELKLFLTASIEVRAQRRFDELTMKGAKTTLKEVSENLKLRDHLDSTRKESPLIQVKDAFVINNTHLTPTEQLKECIVLVQKKIS